MTQNVQEPSAAPIPPIPPESPTITPNEKFWAMICHLSGFALIISPLFGNIIAPLIIWLIKKNTSEYVNDQGREALNFQISMTIYLMIAAVLIFIFIGIPLVLGLLIFDIVMIVKAADQTGQGQRFRYPFTFRFIK